MIELSEIIEILGQPRTKTGYEYIWECPYCVDRHKDNMRFNVKKGILWCFANSEHSKEILRQIGIKKREKEVMEQKHQWDLNKEEYLEYMRLCTEDLLKNQEVLDWLYVKHGIKKSVIELVGIGYDHTENWITIPIFSLKYGCITDFEFRRVSDKKEIRRLGGGCSTIAQIYGIDKNKTLYLVEGFKDGIILTQWLKEKKQKDFTVYSCSHGANSFINCLPEINFSNFEEVKLILDNDGAGDIATKNIIEKYPFIKDSRKFLKDKRAKDITDYYDKYVK